eukprot:GHVP01010772.1.p1 GENE.GHVP01010772.1~~GHVP01010772.1.p1  ORF type:complete len:1620 (+),score=375.21 GHVP01010772.1:113-4972(+)
MKNLTIIIAIIKAYKCLVMSERDLNQLFDMVENIAKSKKKQRNSITESHSFSQQLPSVSNDSRPSFNFSDSSNTGFLISEGMSDFPIYLFQDGDGSEDTELVGSHDASWSPDFLFNKETSGFDLQNFYSQPGGIIQRDTKITSEDFWNMFYKKEDSVVSGSISINRFEEMEKTDLIKSEAPIQQPLLPTGPSAPLVAEVNEAANKKKKEEGLSDDVLAKKDKKKNKGKEPIDPHLAMNQTLLKILAGLLTPEQKKAIGSEIVNQIEGKKPGVKEKNKKGAKDKRSPLLEPRAFDADINGLPKDPEGLENNALTKKPEELDKNGLPMKKESKKEDAPKGPLNELVDQVKKQTPAQVNAENQPKPKGILDKATKKAQINSQNNLSPNEQTNKANTPVNSPVPNEQLNEPVNKGKPQDPANTQNPSTPNEPICQANKNTLENPPIAKGILDAPISKAKKQPPVNNQTPANASVPANQVKPQVPVISEPTDQVTPKPPVTNMPANQAMPVDPVTQKAPVCTPKPNKPVDKKTPSNELINKAKKIPASDPVKQPNQAPVNTPAQALPTNTPAKNGFVNQPNQVLPINTPATSGPVDQQGQAPVNAPTQALPINTMTSNEPANTIKPNEPTNQPKQAPVKNKITSTPINQAKKQIPVNAPVQKTTLNEPVDQVKQQTPGSLQDSYKVVETDMITTPLSVPKKRTKESNTRKLGILGNSTGKNILNNTNSITGMNTSKADNIQNESQLNQTNYDAPMNSISNNVSPSNQMFAEDTMKVLSKIPKRMQNKQMSYNITETPMKDMIINKPIRNTRIPVKEPLKNAIPEESLPYVFSEDSIIPPTPVQENLSSNLIKKECITAPMENMNKFPKQRVTNPSKVTHKGGPKDGEFSESFITPQKLSPIIGNADMDLTDKYIQESVQYGYTESDCAINQGPIGKADSINKVSEEQRLYMVTSSVSKIPSNNNDKKGVKPAEIKKGPKSVKKANSCSIKKEEKPTTQVLPITPNKPSNIYTTQKLLSDEEAFNIRKEELRNKIPNRKKTIIKEKIEEANENITDIKKGLNRTKETAIITLKRIEGGKTGEPETLKWEIEASPKLLNELTPKFVSPITPQSDGIQKESQYNKVIFNEFVCKSPEEETEKNVISDEKEDSGIITEDLKKPEDKVNEFVSILHENKKDLPLCRTCRNKVKTTYKKMEKNATIKNEASPKKIDNDKGILKTKEEITKKDLESIFTKVLYGKSLETDDESQKNINQNVVYADSLKDLTTDDEKPKATNISVVSMNSPNDLRTDYENEKIGINLPSDALDSQSEEAKYILKLTETELNTIFNTVSRIPYKVQHIINLQQRKSGDKGKTKDFKIVKIASGRESVIYKIQNPKTKKWMILKHPSEEFQIYTIKEFKINAAARKGNPFIITPLGLKKNKKGDYLMFFEYLRCSLEELSEKVKLSEEEVKFYIAEVVIAIEKLHKKFIYHGDLTVDNIRLKNGHVCLMDFGNAEAPYSILKSRYFDSRKPGVPSSDTLKKLELMDIVFIGGCVYQLLSGNEFPEEPWPDSIGVKILKKHPFHEEFDIPHSMSKEAADFIKTCRSGGALGMMGGKIRKHPWLKDINWEKIEKLEIRPPYATPTE